MTTAHDALCPTRTVGHAANTACWCAEIAKVRRDERERCLATIFGVRVWRHPIGQNGFRNAPDVLLDVIEALRRPTVTPRDSEPSTGRTGART